MKSKDKKKDSKDKGSNNNKNKYAAVVTLIRDKKKFEHFTPNDVLGRIMTFDMQREEALERW